MQNPSDGFNSSHFFSFLFGFQAFFEFLSGILKETLNPSSGHNSCYPTPFELRTKKCSLILRPPVFNWLQLISAGNARGNNTLPPETPNNHIKAPLLHTAFHWKQKLTSNNIKKQYKIGRELIKNVSAPFNKPFTNKIIHNTGQMFSNTSVAVLPFMIYRISNDKYVAF